MRSSVSEIERSWSVAEREIELGGARSRRRSYAVVVDGKHPGLVDERGNRYREKREGTGE